MDVVFQRALAMEIHTKCHSNLKRTINETRQNTCYLFWKLYTIGRAVTSTWQPAWSHLITAAEHFIAYTLTVCPHYSQFMHNAAVTTKPGLACTPDINSFKKCFCKGTGRTSHAKLLDTRFCQRRWRYLCALCPYCPATGCTPGELSGMLLLQRGAEQCTWGIFFRVSLLSPFKLHGNGSRRWRRTDAPRETVRGLLWYQSCECLRCSMQRVINNCAFNVIFFFLRSIT